MFPTFEHIGPWEVFLFLLLLVGTFLVVGLLSLRPIPLVPYLTSFILIIVQACAGKLTALPTPFFWICFLSCLPFIWAEGNFASVLLFGIIISNWGSDVVPVLPLVFKLVFIVFWPATSLLSGAASVTSLIWWLATVVVLFDKIHFLMHPGYWVGLPVLMTALNLVFKPTSPLIWNVVGSSLVLLQAWLIKPKDSVWKFDIFVPVVSVLSVVRALFIFVYMYPETYFFPFNLISHRYKVSSSVWKSTNCLDDPPNTLCSQCGEFTSKSKLIMGAFQPLVSLVEWHNVSLQRSSSVSISPCDLCGLVWNSVDVDAAETPNGNWRIKVWQERPLSRYVFAKLYLGYKPMGRRLYVHRGKNFGESAMSIKEASTGSAEHVALAKEWISKCTNNHSACTGIGNSPRRMPTRLVHVTKGPDAKPRIKLVVTEPTIQKTEYLAFSHCWGGSSTFRLLKENETASKESIDISALSKNIRDAVVITLQLGYSYIWIDSLCIIQDSHDDWTVEAARMESVYAGATCTLASTGSDSGDGGCFHTRVSMRSLRPCKVGVSKSSGENQQWIYIRRDDLSDFHHGVESAPLNKRGWVLQERFLSRRILHFGAEMLYWECCQRSASELTPNGFVYKKHPEEYYGNFMPYVQAEPDGSDMLPLTRMRRYRIVQKRIPLPDMDTRLSRGIRQNNPAFMKETIRHSHGAWSEDSASGRFRTALDRIRDLDFQDNGVLSFAQCWYSIVEPYSRSNLTFSTDSHIAIQGLVQDIQRSTKYTYIAGLWKEHLAECLLWFKIEGLGKRRIETIAPGKKKQPQPDVPQTIGKVDSIGIKNKNAELLPIIDESISRDDLLVQGTDKADAFDAPSLPAETYTEEFSINPQMAPSWSWLSVDGPVSIDQFPENAHRDVVTTQLATSLTANVNRVKPGPNGESWNAVEGVLEIEAPTLKVWRLKKDNDSWYIYVNFWPRGRSARLIPDLATFGDEFVKDNFPDLFCISLLALKRATEKPFHIKTHEVQGLVVRPVPQREGEAELYERVGFFSTGLVDGGGWHLGKFKKAPREKIRIV